MLAREDPRTEAGGDPSWYKDAVIYEAHVRAFHDSDGDGVGDFRGLTQKLPYLQDLGITVIWLLPFYPSPLRDDGYDIADYGKVNPTYGTMRDFRAFMRAADRLGLRVITELVVNHTSDEHPWFQRARRSPAGSKWRDFYVWSDTPSRYAEARIIFQDFESSNWAWDPVAKAYYWHRFYSHQPDLNYHNPLVRRAVLQTMDQWLGMGVSGLRLDAVPYLFEKEGTNCENLPETHALLKTLRRHMDESYGDRLLLAEANQWPEDSVAYFGQGDESHMAYHFPLMPRMFMALRMEDRLPIVDILEQTPAIPDTCQWALFLRNHDELTLEMVTDEERDYMYRVYAPDPQARINLGIRRRLAPLLNNDRRKIELMNGLLFSLPGTPVIYYGDEIGMGDNFYLGDRNGVRTPMQWSPGRNAGFSSANPQRLYLPVIVDPEYHYAAVNVEAQQTNPNSLLWWMKRLIALRKRYKAFGRGSLEVLNSDNRKVFCFLRRYEGETILVVANLSRLAQHAFLDLAAFEGRTPVELSGGTRFPPIGVAAYPLTLGPYGFYWFSLAGQRAERTGSGISRPEDAVRTLTLAGRDDDPFTEELRASLAPALVSYVRRSRWFGGKARRIDAAEIRDVIPIPYDASSASIALLRLDYVEGESETYVLPLAVASAEQAEKLVADQPGAVVARLRSAGTGGLGERVLYEALADNGFCNALLQSIAANRAFRGEIGEVRSSRTRAFRGLRGPSAEPLETSVLKVEQSNTSVVYGDRFILKLFRRLEEGINPELEVGRFLSERASFPAVPPVAGALEYTRHRKEAPSTLGVLHGYVRHQDDAWRYTLDAVGHYFERVLAHPEVETPSIPRGALLELSREEVPPLAQETIGPYLVAARLLGRRTAEMHLALAGDPDDPDFAPEPFTDLYRRSLYQSMRTQAGQLFRTLRREMDGLSGPTRDRAEAVSRLERQVLERFHSVLDRRFTAMRTRCHGDFHLGQVLCTGNDFVIIDFEGEPARAASERRIKRSPLRDVAGMLRSFHYAANVGLLGHAPGVPRPEDIPDLEWWASFWNRWVAAAFLASYVEVASSQPFLPADQGELGALLDFYQLEKAVYEVGYELNNRPSWVRVPLEGILDLLGERE